MDKDIVISLKTVIYTALFALAGYIVYKLFPIIALVFMSTLIVIVLEPAVLYLTKTKIFGRYLPRSAAVGVTYVFTVFALIVTLTIGLPPVVLQAQKLLVLAGFDFSKDYFQLLDTIFGDISQLSSVVNRGSLSSVFNAVGSVFSNLFTIISLLAISVFMSLDWINLKRRIFEFIPSHHRDEVKDAVKEIETSIGNWASGQLLLMLIVGGMSTVGLFLLGVDYALALGLLSGLFEIVPFIGPIASAIFAFIVAYTISPWHGLAVVILFLIIQQLENNLLVPKVMQKVSGFSPLVILIAVLAGGKVFGIIGAVVAIPIFMILVIIAKHLWEHSNHNHRNNE